MNCEAFERWLDDAMPARDADVARAHAAACVQCAASLRAAIEIESLLDVDPASTPAPAGFAARVMVRVDETNEARAHVPALLPSAFDWWVRIAASPACALSAVVAALVVWRGAALWSAAAGWASAISTLAASVHWSIPIAAPFDRPDVMLGLVVASLPAALWAGRALYQWSERLVVAGALTHQ